MRGLEFYRTAHFGVCIHINSFAQIFEHFYVKETALDVWDASLNKTIKKKIPATMEFMFSTRIWASCHIFFPRDSVINRHHQEPVYWTILIPTCHSYYYFIYLFGCAGFWLWHTGSSVFVAAYRIFSFGMQTLSCGMWDLVSWPGIEPWPPALGG